MAKIARHTEWSQKRADAAIQGLKNAREDPRIGPAWAAAREAYARVLAHGVGKHYPLSQEDAEALLAERSHDLAVYRTRRRDLLMLISEYAPQLEQEYGPKLGEFVHICHHGELGLEKPQELGQYKQRLSPNNPIERLGENVFYIPEDVVAFGDAKHRRACLLELDGWLTTLQGDTKRGRPTKGPNKEVEQGQRKQDPEREALALKAHQIAEQLADRGQKNWKAVADALGRTIPPDRHGQKRLNTYIRDLTLQRRLSISRFISMGCSVFMPSVLTVFIALTP
jgi:hypothetical protein